MSETPLLRERFEGEVELADRLRAASAEERPRLYLEVYDEYARRFGAEPLPVAQRREEVALQRALLEPLIPSGGVFAEIGCGDGALAVAIAESGVETIAVDASVEGTRGRVWPEKARFQVGDATRLGLEPESIDLAYSCHFLEHLHPEDASTHAARVLEVLRPGGAYVVITPNRLWGPHDVSGRFVEELGPDPSPRGLHLCEYGFGELADLLLEAGFGEARALSGIGRPARPRRIWPYRMLEAVASTLPRRGRRRLLGLLSRHPEPFRALEQVVVMGSRVRGA